MFWFCDDAANRDAQQFIKFTHVGQKLLTSA